MAHYIVSARPMVSRIEELKIHLEEDTFRPLKPFGNELTDSLLNARINEDTGIAQWEEEDYCTHPLPKKEQPYWISISPTSAWKRCKKAKAGNGLLICPGFLRRCRRV